MSVRQDIGSITVDIIPDIEERIHDQLVKLRDASMEEPEAILLGPLEYMSLCMRVSAQRFLRAEFCPVTEYVGFRVFPKITPGIDFAIDHNRVPAYASLPPKTTSEAAFREYLQKLKGK